MGGKHDGQKFSRMVANFVNAHSSSRGHGLGVRSKKSPYKVGRSNRAAALSVVVQVNNLNPFVYIALSRFHFNVRSGTATSPLL